jgi:hypothetical protein
MDITSLDRQHTAAGLAEGRVMTSLEDRWGPLSKYQRGYEAGQPPQSCSWLSALTLSVSWHMARAWPRPRLG